MAGLTPDPWSLEPCPPICPPGPGLLGGLGAGFPGAGLFGMLFGHGLMGGLGGFASFLGLMLQIGLVVIVGYFLWQWWQRRSQRQPAFAAAAPNLRSVDLGREAPGGSPRPAMGLGLGGGAAPAPASGPDEIATTPADFDAFERLLGEIWTAYGAEDLAALR